MKDEWKVYMESGKKFPKEDTGIEERRYFDFAKNIMTMYQL